MTDWERIRELMNAAIDGLSAVDARRIAPEDRARCAEVAGTRVSVHDALISAWTAPENLRSEVIRARGRLGDAAPCTPDTARALIHVAQLCAELVGAARLDLPDDPDDNTIDARIGALCGWYRDHLPDVVQRALAEDRSPEA